MLWSADPRLTDWDLLLENIRDLRAGKPAEVPHYDFKQSKRTGYTKVPVPRSRVVIVEGIYALSARLRPQLDLRVSIQGGVHFDLVSVTPRTRHDRDPHLLAGVMVCTLLSPLRGSLHRTPGTVLRVLHGFR